MNIIYLVSRLLHLTPNMNAWPRVFPANRVLYTFWCHYWLQNKSLLLSWKAFSPKKQSYLMQSASKLFRVICFFFGHKYLNMFLFFSLFFNINCCFMQKSPSMRRVLFTICLLYTAQFILFEPRSLVLNKVKCINELFWVIGLFPTNKIELRHAFSKTNYALFSMFI